MVWFVVGVGFHIVVPWVIETARSWFPSLSLPSQSGRRSPFPFKWILVHAANTLQVGAFLWLAAALYAAGWTNLRPYAGFHWSTPVRVGIEVVAILALMDFHFYWGHRLLHGSPWLYRHVHLLHHRAVNPTAWHSNMQHPLEFAFTTLAPAFWILFLPFSIEAYILATIQAHLINIGGHAGYEMTRSWLGKISPHGVMALLDPRRRHLGRAWATTTHHDLHHRKLTRNFGLYFTWWDYLARTDVPEIGETHSRAEGPTAGGSGREGADPHVPGAGVVQDLPTGPRERCEVDAA